MSAQPVQTLEWRDGLIQSEVDLDILSDLAREFRLDGLDLPLDDNEVKETFERDDNLNTNAFKSEYRAKLSAWLARGDIILNSEALELITTALKEYRDGAPIEKWGNYIYFIKAARMLDSTRARQAQEAEAAGG